MSSTTPEKFFVTVSQDILVTIARDVHQDFTVVRTALVSGFYRNSSRNLFSSQFMLSGEKCVPCECNGNIDPSEVNSCDHLTGKCLKCLNNTFGDACDRCAPGFYGDAVNAKDCQRK